MKKILYLSHTDISTDSRILKSIDVAQSASFLTKAIGVKGREIDRLKNAVINKNIISLNLLSRHLTIIPNQIRHAISFVEFFIKSLIIAAKYKPNVIHCNDNISLPISCALKIISRSSIIYDAHELESNKNHQTKIAGKFVLIIEKLCWKYIDDLITVSSTIGDWYIKNIGEKPTTIIYNTPSFAESELSEYDDGNYLREKFNIASERKIFIYVGAIMPGRGLELLIKSFQIDGNNGAMVIMGYGDYKEDLLFKINSKNKIFFHEPVPHEQVVPIVKNADYGLCIIENVSLSDFYSLPNKLFEYAFAKVPVLASNFPELSKIVQRYKLGECVDIDKNKIAMKMIELQNKEDCEIDKEFFCDFNWTTQSEKLTSVYRKYN